MIPDNTKPDREADGKCADPSASPHNCPDSPGHVDVTAMIRSLQRSEGHADCFRTGMNDCDQADCPWRVYCLDASCRLPGGSGR